MFDALGGGIVPFTEAAADEAAELFNKLGRPTQKNERQRMDCLIAATAIRASAELASFDKGFPPMVPHGLCLVPELLENDL